MKCGTSTNYVAFNDNDKQIELSAQTSLSAKKEATQLGYSKIGWVSLTGKTVKRIWQKENGRWAEKQV